MVFAYFFKMLRNVRSFELSSGTFSLTPGVGDGVPPRGVADWEMSEPASDGGAEGVGVACPEEVDAIELVEVRIRR